MTFPDSEMAPFLHITWSSDPQFCVTHCAGVPLVTRHAILMEWTKLWSPKSVHFHELLIKELYVIPLAGHLGVQKLSSYIISKGFGDAKLHERVTSFVCSCTTFVQTKDSTAVPPGLLQPLPVPESRFSSWSIDFTTDLPLSHGCNTILTYVDCLTKYITSHSL